jgi:hypothetical protein
MRASSCLNVILCLHRGSSKKRFLLTRLLNPPLYVWMTIQIQGWVRISEGTRRCPQQNTPIIAHLLWHWRVAFDRSQWYLIHDLDALLPWIHELCPRFSSIWSLLDLFPDCSYLYFKKTAIALGKWGQWANCKHLCFIFTVICGLNPHVDDFMHVPSSSFNEVKHAFQMGS